MNSPKKPVISIIMPVYNQDRYVTVAINSIINQSFKNWELIIIDDGSFDATQKYIRSFSDRRIMYFRNSKNRGIAWSLNKALTFAKGELIARMDADDIALPERLKTQVEFLYRHPQIGIVGSAAILIDAQDNKTGIKSLPVSDRSLKKVLHYMNPFIHPSVMFRQSLLKKTGRYDPSLEGAEDYDLWLRLAKVTEIANLKTPLIKYRLHPANVSFAGTRRLRLAYAKVQIKKISDYGYPMWEVIFSIKALLTLIVPVSISQFIYTRFYGYARY